jgi:hypothetical protein
MTLTGLKVSDGLGLVGIKVSEDSDWNEERAAITGQGIVRMLACCEEILKDKMRCVSRQNSVLDFFQSSSGTRSSPPVLLDMWR